MSHLRLNILLWGVVLSGLPVLSTMAAERQFTSYANSPASDMTAHENADYLRDYPHRYQQVGYFFPEEQLPNTDALFRSSSDVPVIEASSPPPVPPMASPRKSTAGSGVMSALPGGHSLPESGAAAEYQPFQYSDTQYAVPERLMENPGGLPYYEDVSVMPLTDSDGTNCGGWFSCSPEFCNSHCSWTWTLLPKDLLWQSYVGGPREPRFSQSIVHLNGTGTLWKLQAGGRVGILRYGSSGCEPLEGLQVDLWGTAFPRLNLSQSSELEAVDFRVGVPLTWRQGPWQTKLEWYHVSAHVGDEFLLRPENAGFNRLDYLRDSIVLGIGYFATPDTRLYAEADYAYKVNDGAEPWHFQFGVDYAPVRATPINRPDFFFAINGSMRQEVNWSGGLNIVAGVQWRGDETQHALRTGLHYYQGQSLQFSFLGDYEEFLGWGMWYDF